MVRVLAPIEGGIDTGPARSPPVAQSAPAPGPEHEEFDMPTDPFSGLRPDEVAAAWSTRGLDRLTDGELLAAVTDVLSTPRTAPHDSFALHAPLEVMARAELLTMVSPAVREATRQRLVEIACTWATRGRPLELPDTSEVDRPAARLAEGLHAGDLAEVDRAFVALCAERDQDQIIGDLADLVLPHLGGAGHGAIFLELLPRFRIHGGCPALAARTLLRDLAMHPGWKLTWFDDAAAPQAVPAAEAPAVLWDRLRAPHAVHRPPNTFIHPTMSLVDESGLADDLLADLTPSISIDEARRGLLRIAATSMLQDEPASAPYGWSHCLTMPQAALAIAERASRPQLAVDVASTYVLGFRAMLSSSAIDPDRAPERPSGHQSGDVLRADPSAAAAMAWHADPAQRGRIHQQLIDHAAPHPDAHLAKYTLACLDASRADPEAAALFGAAAAYLGAWWHQQGPPTE